MVILPLLHVLSLAIVFGPLFWRERLRNTVSGRLIERMSHIGWIPTLDFDPEAR